MHVPRFRLHGARSRARSISECAFCLHMFQPYPRLGDRAIRLVAFSRRLSSIPSVAPTVLISSLLGAVVLLLPRSTAPDKLVYPLLALTISYDDCSAVPAVLGAWPPSRRRMDQTSTTARVRSPTRQQAPCRSASQSARQTGSLPIADEDIASCCVRARPNACPPPTCIGGGLVRSRTSYTDCPSFTIPSFTRVVRGVNGLGEFEPALTGSRSKEKCRAFDGDRMHQMVRPTLLAKYSLEQRKFSRPLSQAISRPHRFFVRLLDITYRLDQLLIMAQFQHSAHGPITTSMRRPPPKAWLPRVLLPGPTRYQTVWVGPGRTMESQYETCLRGERRLRVDSLWVLQKDLCNGSHSNARHQLWPLPGPLSASLLRSQKTSCPSISKGGAGRVGPSALDLFRPRGSRWLAG
ncbi:hypothetical protein TgHK011_005361 [Trichoderma gracile]|nr:hypothetical protein TgHK011_005361 [Trichoderma gracile]